MGVALDEVTSTVSLHHPEQGRVDVALDAPEAATGVVGEWFPGKDSAPSVLVRASSGYWDEIEGELSIVNLDRVDALSRAARTPIDPLRFRANLYVSGLGPWVEPELVGEHITVDDVRLHVLHPMSRCPATCVNPANADVDINVPAELTTQFGHIFCGVRARVLTSGTLCTGAAVARTGHRGTAVPGAAGPAPAWWPRLARIVRKEAENDSVTNLWLRDPLGGLVAAPRPGQHLRMLSTDRPLWRCYTISGVDRGDIRISVQHESCGRCPACCTRRPTSEPASRSPDRAGGDPRCRIQRTDCVDQRWNRHHAVPCHAAILRHRDLRTRGAAVPRRAERGRARALS